MENEADMVIGDRLSNGTYQDENDRVFHNSFSLFLERLSLVHKMRINVFFFPKRNNKML